LSLLGGLCSLELCLELSLLSLSLSENLGLELLLLLLLLRLKDQDLILELQLQCLLLSVQATQGTIKSATHSPLVLEHLHHHQLLLLLEPIGIGKRRSHRDAIHHATRAHGAIPTKCHLLHLGGEEILVVFVDRSVAVTM
jgi:hypothetical protein